MKLIEPGAPDFVVTFPGGMLTVAGSGNEGALNASELEWEVNLV